MEWLSKHETSKYIWSSTPIGFTSTYSRDPGRKLLLLLSPRSRRIKADMYPGPRWPPGAPKCFCCRSNGHFTKDYQKEHPGGHKGGHVPPAKEIMEIWLSLKAKNLRVSHFLLDLPHGTEAAQGTPHVLVPHQISIQETQVVLIMEGKPISFLLDTREQLPLFRALALAPFPLLQQPKGPLGVPN